MATNNLSTNQELIAKPSLPQYVFTEKLGSGTYATVFKAYRKCGEREVVAVKCVLKSSLNKASTENLLTEIELLKALKHEHIVILKDFQWDTNYIYLIMEYCSGGDLSRFIRSKRALPEHMVKRFLQQIASAMKFLWDNNVAHMDLKPQNILLTSESSPQIKLADFGFAKNLFDGDRVYVMRGSPLYMAPEIICRGVYDNRVDLWSIGVILYECLFGKAPFASKSFKELGEKIWDQKPIEIPPGFNISDNARDLILRLLQRVPARRITFEEFFAHPFVDMEHIPSKDSLPKAIALIDRAVKKDEEGDYKAAVKLYCEALDFFMPAIHYEKSLEKKKALRLKVKEYMDRAETLKQFMKKELHNPSTSPKPRADSLPKTPAGSSSPTAPSLTNQDSSPVANKCDSSPKTLLDRSTSCDISELKSLCSDSQELSAILKLVSAAEFEEQKEDFENCLHHYELALGGLLKLLPGEPKGRRKELLNSQATKWMEKAEKIKSYLDVRNLNTQDTSAQEELAETSYFNEWKQCCIQ
ncbi:serine/threonine-protein kinase ULK3 [Biomphalaria pfeifferi]|uniref:Serine/threonine-protein kinase ULK3 n=1 Tax=Biomphalaria pfeifferi TaxID=112525 RepID=A0AAD8BQD1_BIOPF|nr:serine/threonine-protein kinase ULK3 [Biomphalaria pfeifferi]